MLKLLGKDLKITVIYILKELLKVWPVCMWNFIREMKTIKKFNENARIKNKISEMKNYFKIVINMLEVTEKNQ